MTGTYPIPALGHTATFVAYMPWQDVTFSSLTDVRECLDALERQGVHEQEFSIVSGEFHVRWR